MLLRQSGCVGGRVPAGMRVIGPPGGRVLEVDPVEGAKVAPAWSMIAAGKTLRDVGLALDRAGVPCSGKDGWTTQGVHGLITNKRYVGMLVSAADFDRAQEALKARTCPGRRRDSATGGSGAGPRAKASRVWLLSGIARCGRCGSAMVGVSATGGSGGLYHYYRCTGRVHGGKNRCMQPDLSADRWEPAVIEALGRVVRKGGDLGPALIDVQRRLQQAMAPLTAERQALTMELDRIRAEIGRLVDLAASGASVATALAQGLQERQAKVADLEARIGALTGRIAIGALNDDQLQSLISRVHDNLATLERDTPEEQAKTLRILLTKAVLKPHPKDKGKGEVDLAIDLPSLVSAAFVSPSSMVVLSGMETNALCFSMAVFTGLRRAS